MSNLPSYLASAKPVPAEDRVSWLKTITPIYLGIMLSFLFWQDVIAAGKGTNAPPGGVLAHGYFHAILGLTIAAVICHFFLYLGPGLLGMKTGQRFGVVATSTYGARGGWLLPGLLMGVFQLGVLGMISWSVAKMLALNLAPGPKPVDPDLHFGLSAGAFDIPTQTTVPHWIPAIIAVVFAIIAVWIGLGGVKRLGRFATWLPLISVVVLFLLLVSTFSGLGKFGLDKLPGMAEVAPYAIDQMDQDMIRSQTMQPPWTEWEVVGALCVYVVGFFAIAGAAATDIASHTRSIEDVHGGGIWGILVPTALIGMATAFVVAGAYGGDMVSAQHFAAHNYNPVDLMPDIFAATRLGPVWGGRMAAVAAIGLAISALPIAGFASLVAGNSFKTLLPKINPWVSVGVGTAAAVAMAIAGWIGDLRSIVELLGAAFAPVCGAMLADYLLSGRKWSGPRAGFNPAGWISWIVGFALGISNILPAFASEHEWDWLFQILPKLSEWGNSVPLPPVMALAAGFALYVGLSVVGLRTRKLVIL